MEGSRQGVDDLLLAVNVGVEQTQNVVEVALSIPLVWILLRACTSAQSICRAACFLPPFPAFLDCGCRETSAAIEQPKSSEPQWKSRISKCHRWPPIAVLSSMKNCLPNAMPAPQGYDAHYRSWHVALLVCRVFRQLSIVQFRSWECRMHLWIECSSIGSVTVAVGVAAAGRWSAAGKSQTMKSFILDVHVPSRPIRDS